MDEINKNVSSDFDNALKGLDIQNITSITFSEPKIEFPQIVSNIKMQHKTPGYITANYFKDAYENRRQIYGKKSALKCVKKLKYIFYFT